jgi:hypothetical protein
MPSAFLKKKYFLDVFWSPSTAPWNLIRGLIKKKGRASNQIPPGKSFGDGGQDIKKDI